MAGKRKAVTPPRTPLKERLRAGLVRLLSRGFTHLLLPILLPVLVVTILLAGLYALQFGLREQSGPVLTRFADIDCPAPPGLTRAEFLANVQAFANVPDRLDLLDTGLPGRLTEAFASEPWVEKVERIIPTTSGLRVVLTFRVAVLGVTVRDKFRAVDAQAILLPEKAGREDLPRFTGPIDLPNPRPGSVLADRRLMDAARVAGFLSPYQERLRLEKISIDPRGLLLITAWGRTIVWGSPPGAEAVGEATAEQKLARLLRPTTDSGLVELDLRR